MSQGYDTSKLFCVRYVSGGIQAACPVCRENGQDKTGNHLKIFNNGAFHCIVGSSDPNHNRRIYQLLRDPNAEVIQFIDNEPTRGAHVEKIYPEEWLNRLLKDHSYWLNRGAQKEVMDLLEGGIAPSDERSKLSGRYIIPLRNLDRQICGFSGRSLIPNSFAPKYKHLVKVSKLCWPWHLAGEEITRTGVVIFVEGWSDWIFLRGAGIKNVLCLFGLNLNSVIVGQLISANVRKIVISLNNDDDPNKAQAATEKIRKKLVNFWAEDCVINRPPSLPHKDWGAAVEANDAQAFETFKEELARL